MLTVKHRLPGGHEYVLETKRVSYQPQVGAENQPRAVFVEREDGSMSLSYSGVFYVMNEAGNTVAKYDLGEGNPDGY